MSELASADKLRGYMLLDRGDGLSAIIDSDEIADEIEREVSERFMELPVDMDGVPIRPGDTVVVDGEEIVVSTVERRCWVDAQGYIYSPKGTSHIKPRTIEDVLREFAAEYHNAASSPNTFDSDGMIERCADELRGMMAGDAE